MLAKICHYCLSLKRMAYHALTQEISAEDIAICQCVHKVRPILATRVYNIN